MAAQATDKLQQLDREIPFFSCISENVTDRPSERREQHPRGCPRSWPERPR